MLKTCTNCALLEVKGIYMLETAKFFAIYRHKEELFMYGVHT